jgi:hypothetical protein
MPQNSEKDIVRIPLSWVSKLRGFILTSNNSDEVVDKMLKYGIEEEDEFNSRLIGGDEKK